MVAKVGFYLSHILYGNHWLLYVRVERHFLSGVRAPTCSGTYRNAFSGKGKHGL